MKIVIDTNIVFSAILNPENKIAKIILYSKRYFQLYTCDFLKTELLKHRAKLIKLTKLNSAELDELEFLLTKGISFINENLIPRSTIIDTESELEDIDLNDTPFVALAKHIDAKLWTGDKELISGLRLGNFIETLTTAELSDLLDKLEQQI